MKLNIHSASRPQAVWHRKALQAWSQARRECTMCRGYVQHRSARVPLTRRARSLDGPANTVHSEHHRWYHRSAMHALLADSLGGVRLESATVAVCFSRAQFSLGQRSASYRDLTVRKIFSFFVKVCFYTFSYIFLQIC